MPIIKTVHLVETQKTKNDIKRCATRYLILPSNKLLNSQTRIELMRILCSVCIIRVLDFMKFIFCCSLNFFRYYLKYERITKRRDKAFVIVHFPIPFLTFVHRLVIYLIETNHPRLFLSFLTSSLPHFTLIT